MVVAIVIVGVTLVDINAAHTVARIAIVAGAREGTTVVVASRK
jgi:hypothetical protein